MPKFYSQHGEDFLLNEIFKEKENGFFVEVGCIEGRRFSNTLTFEERGWKGLCVEAHSGYIELLAKNRPNSVICHCAAAEKDEDGVTFYANSRGSLSTLDRSKEEEFKKGFGKFFTGFEEQKIVKRRLDSLFREFGVKEIDLLSLDIEGYEVEALRGIDFNVYKPTVMVIESDSPEHRRGVEEIIIPAGYHKIASLANNIFYSMDEDMGRRIKGKLYRNIRIIHTQHPLDRDGDKTLTVDIDTTERSGADDGSLISSFVKRLLSS